MGKKDAQQKGLLDLAEEVGAIETTLGLETLTLKGLRWYAKLTVKTILPRAYHRYQVLLTYDRKPHEDRIAELEKSLDDSLFKDDKAQRRQVTDRVKKMRAQMDAEAKDCEKIEFGAVVETLAYKEGETVLVVRVPDDVIEAFNRQKHRLQLYVIKLVPVFGMVATGPVLPVAAAEPKEK